MERRMSIICEEDDDDDQYVMLTVNQFGTKEL